MPERIHITRTLYLEETPTGEWALYTMPNPRFFGSHLAGLLSKGEDGLWGFNGVSDSLSYPLRYKTRDKLVEGLKRDLFRIP